MALEPPEHRLVSSANNNGSVLLHTLQRSFIEIIKSKGPKIVINTQNAFSCINLSSPVRHICVSELGWWWGHTPLFDCYHKDGETHTACTIVAWHTFKQWTRSPQVSYILHNTLSIKLSVHGDSARLNDHPASRSGSQLFWQILQPNVVSSRAPAYGTMVHRRAARGPDFEI